jgi:ComF family protein
LKFEAGGLNSPSDHKPQMLDRLNNLFSTVARVSSGVRDAAVTMIYPTPCRVCGRVIESWRDGVACAQCWREIEQKRLGADFCARCGMPLEPVPSHIRIGERRCGRCDDFAFGCARACGPYEGALRESVLQLKLHPHLPRRLRELLRLAFASLPDNDRIESIIPVPLHPARLQERGFNQAEVIARALAASTGLRPDPSAVARVKQTERHRAGMGARERARSLDRAFGIRAPRLIEGRALLVVDDVMTTGSTSQELTGTLLEGGARAVSVLTLARAISQIIQ